MVNANNQPIPNLPIDVIANTSPIAFHGGSEWQVTTDSTGHFTLPQLASQVQPYWTWSATATFPWFGSTVPLNLGTVATSDPTKLEFRSDPGNSLNYWRVFTSCLNVGAASSVTITFTPVRLVDGSSGSAATLTKSTSDACDVGYYNIPAGAWTLSNATDNLGRPVVLSTDDKTFSANVEVGTGTSDTDIWLGFEPSTGS